MSSLSSISAGSLLGAGRLNVTGLASGLDTDKIIEGLLTIQQKRIENLESNQSKIQQKQAAFKAVEAGVLTLQSSLAQLARTQGGVFQVRNATSNNESLVTAAASSAAQAGNYQLRVNALAQAHQIAAQGFDSPASAITQGTLQIRAGAAAAVTITIDSSNNTLQGLANAINSAGAGVSAAIVNDGSPGHTQPYRLLLTASKTGAANAITVTNNLVAEGGGAVRPIFDAAFVGAANLDTGFTGTSAVASNRGAGAFTGTANNSYRFTVVAGGLVGTDNNLQVSFTDTSGAHTGTITVNAVDVDTFKTVAEGVQVKFGAGTLVAGETFTVDGYVPVVQQAADASVTVGSGLGALTVQSASNQLDGLFTGIAVDLHAADAAKLVTLTVTNDQEKAKTTIQGFVDGFNDLMKFIDEQVKFNPDTSEAGVLLGNRQVIDLQDQVRREILRPVAGLKSQMNRLSALGITTSDQGRLVVNQAKLEDALAGRIAGVTFDDVRRLFALSGTSSLTGVEFVTGSAKTVSSATPYQVSVTQAAQQASILATSPLAASTVLTGSNNTFGLSVDGALSSTITLTPGTYTRAALAQEIQAQINANTNLGGRQVAVALNGDNLTVTSNSYGSTSAVAIGAGTALAPLGFAGSETDVGQNVAGSYLVNGVVETATGTGQFLAGASTNANTSGLQVRVLLSSAQVGAGVTGDLSVSRGVASNLDVALSSLLDPTNGRLKTINEGFSTTIDDIKAEIARQTELNLAKRDSLLRQFAAMEATISKLQGVGNFLSTQFNQINALNSAGR